MNRKRSRDIYEAPDAAQKSKKLGKQEPGKSADPWYEIFLQSRRSFLIFRLILLAFLITIGMVLVEQFKASTRQMEKGRIIELEVNIRSNPVFDLEGDIRMQFVMDELEEIQTANVPKEGAPPFTAHWLKQAAYYLLQAENAYRREAWEEAADSYEIVKDIVPGVKGIEAQLGLCYMRMRDFDRSEEAFALAREQQDDSFRLINNLGVAKLAVQKYDEAEGLFLQALERNPDYAPAILNLALLYYKIEQLEKSADYFKNYFEISPLNIEALQTYVLVLIELQRWEEAAKLLTGTARLRPQAAPIHFRLAQVLSHTGDTEGAIQSLERAVKLLDSRKALALLARYDLELLRDRPEYKKLVNDLTFRED